MHNLFVNHRGHVCNAFSHSWIMAQPPAMSSPLLAHSLGHPHPSCLLSIEHSLTMLLQKQSRSLLQLFETRLLKFHRNCGRHGSPFSAFILTHLNEQLCPATFLSQTLLANSAHQSSIGLANPLLRNCLPQLRQLPPEAHLPEPPQWQRS